MTGTETTREEISLAGDWQLAFDPAGEGVAAGWAAGRYPQDSADTVQVPALWDVTHPQAEGVGFYRRTFTVPQTWAGKVVLLHSAGAAYRAEAWVNGRFVGSHEGAYSPFWFDITACANFGGDNELVIRVAGFSRDREVDGVALLQAPASKQSWYYIHTGLWGEVSLQALPWVAVEAARVEPDLHREMALVELRIRNRRAEHCLLDVRLTLRQADGAVAAEQGGRVAVPGPDTGTLAINSPDRALTRRILNHFMDNVINGWVGRALPGMFRSAGLTDIEIEPTSVVFEDFPLVRQLWLQSVADNARDAGVVTAAEAQGWLDGLERASQNEGFFYSGTTFIVSGRKP